MASMLSASTRWPSETGWPVTGKENERPRTTGGNRRNYRINSCNYTSVDPKQFVCRSKPWRSRKHFDRSAASYFMSQSTQNVPGDKWETSVKSSGQRIQSVDTRETSAKSCGPKHPKHPECTRRQVGEKAYSVVGVVGDEWGHTARVHWETSGREVGKWETSQRQA